MRGFRRVGYTVTPSLAKYLPSILEIDPAFYPTDIANCHQLIDLSNINTLFTDSAKTTPVTSDGDVIGAAEDLSGNGNDILQATTANKALYKTGIQNGLSAGLFDDADDHYQSAAWPELSQPNTIFVIGKATTPAKTSQILYDGISATKRNQTWFRYPAGQDNYAFFAGTTVQKQQLWTSDCFLFSTYYNGAASELFLNNASFQTGNCSTFGLTGLTVGATNSIAYFWDGYIMCVAVYDSSVSSEDRSLFWTWANNKWSIW